MKGHYHEIDKVVQYSEKQLVFCRKDLESITSIYSPRNEKRLNVNTQLLNLKNRMTKLQGDIVKFNKAIDKAWNEVHKTE
jgi:hypothetical protein